MGKTIQHDQYETRAKALAELGFASYAHYLTSPLWFDIKRRRMGKKRQCAVCKSKYRKAYTLHHASYSVPVLLGKRMDLLFPICRSCHYAVEFDADGNKRTDGVRIHQTLLHRRTTQKKRRVAAQLAWKDGKRKKKANRPTCRICKKKGAGRERICIGCYKRYRERVHEIAAQHEQAKAT